MLRLALVALLLAPLTADSRRCKRAKLELPSQTEAWNRRRTRRFTVTAGSPRHRAQDLLALVDTHPVAIGKFAYGKIDKDLKVERVAVYAQTGPPCGPWRRLGIAVTTDGDHRTERGVEDDGGRVYYPISDVLPVGQHRLKYLVLGDHSEAEASVFVVEPATQAVVFDIDGTLTVGDGEIITQLQEKGYVPRMWPDATKLVRAYADKGYLIVYVTGRPDNLKRLTVEWLVRMGFPPGPVRLADTLRQARPSSSGVGAFKTAHLRRLTRSVRLDVVAAYGNAVTDIQAYAAVGLSKHVTYIIGEHAGEDGTVALDSYTAQLEVVKKVPAATVAAPPNLVW